MPPYTSPIRAPLASRQSSNSSVAKASIGATRTSNGATTHIVFEYGGELMAGVHAAGLLFEDMKDLSLEEVQSGRVSGWIKLGDANHAVEKKRGRAETGTSSVMFPLEKVRGDGSSSGGTPVATGRTASAEEKPQVLR